jgi:Zn-dependent M28 family amino/carboxypeptidase
MTAGRGAVNTPTLFPTAAGSRARQHLLALSEEIGPRPAGSSGEAEAARYIQEAFREMGYEPAVLAFLAAVKQGENQIEIDSANVIAVKEGLSKKTIIVGAHYDSVRAGRGADDNASGVAVLLESAERIKEASPPYTIRFVAFGAEEVGLKGSSRYVEQMSLADIAGTVVMINLDSLIAGDHAYIYGDGENGSSLRDWALAQAPELGLDLKTQPGENPAFPAGTTGDWSDHAPFKQAGIDYAYLESTNWALGEKDGYTQTDPEVGEAGQIWHTPFDAMAYIEEVFPGRIDQHLNLFVTLLTHILTKYS